jgi:acyl carrier protein
MDKVNVTAQVLAAIEQLNRQLPPEQRIPAEADTSLFGKGGRLDSLGLVNLLLLVEEQIVDSLGVSITIADERALSLKHSPFRDVHSLADYVAQLVEEARHD